MGILFQIATRSEDRRQFTKTIRRFYIGESPDLVYRQEYRLRILSDCVLVFSTDLKRFYGKFPWNKSEWI